MSYAERQQIDVRLPVLHTGQIDAWDSLTRFFAVRCGRRWGKTTFGQTVACDGAIKSQLIGWFAPDYKRITEVWHEISDTLQPVKASASRVDGVYRTITGGRIDFWTLEDENAGRSRKYHKVIMDEAAFAKSNAMAIWERAIKPTLIDFAGSALVLSNTNGAVPDQFFYEICNDPKHGFTSYHAPSHANPLLPRGDLMAWEKSSHPLVWRQEYLAEFVDWSGVAFFALPNLLVNDQGIDVPPGCENVFAVVDTAMKTGKENDGTAVIYYAWDSIRGLLYILDWDIIQIEGAMLEKWLPGVFTTLESLSRQVKARMGSLGAMIEDKNSGTILIQQALNHKWPAQAIPETLTDMGKDERALAVSGNVYNNKVKLTKHAYDKTVIYKGVARNHLVTQVTGFKIGDKDAAKRADDLLDCFTYGVAMALGNADGY